MAGLPYIGEFGFGAAIGSGAVIGLWSEIEYILSFMVKTFFQIRSGQGAFSIHCSYLYK